MAGGLRVRVYNVLFGDAVLLTIPEIDAAGNKVVVHVLIDVGNAIMGEGGRDDVLTAVIENVRDELGGKPLDLYVMTHEHMDHVQGLLYGARKLGIEFEVRHLWMTASSEGTPYYDRFPRARKKRLAALDAYEDVATFLAKSAVPTPSDIGSLLAINNPRSSNDCVAYIRTRGPEGQGPSYLHRDSAIDGRHPFSRTKVSLLAPEVDTSIYYGPLPPRTLGASVEGAAALSLDAHAVTPPAGVSAGHFFDLLEFRASGMTANIRTIDKAANNSSVAIELEWNGWRLLFPGDAEEKSWEMMERTGRLRPVHFLKVSHHGSKNGSPRHQLDKVFPAHPHDDRARFAVVSTRDGSYPGVPDEPTLALLGERAVLADTRTLPDGGWFDFTFPERAGKAPTLTRSGLRRPSPASTSPSRPSSGSR